MMPELPEVETVRLALVPALAGRKLARVVVRKRDLRVPLPRDFEARLTGHKVLAVRRRAKFLLVRLQGGTTLVIHLGMSGRIRIFRKNPPPPEKHDHVELKTDAGRVVRYNDARRFGAMALIADKDLSSHPWFRALGPEPFNVAYVQPSRRPADGRFGENPNRLFQHHQFQVILKPAPKDTQAGSDRHSQAALPVFSSFGSTVSAAHRKPWLRLIWASAGAARLHTRATST